MKLRWFVWALLMIAGATHAAPYPLADDFESGLGLWVTNGTWGLTTAGPRSPTHAAADSPGAFYTNNTDAALALASGMNLGAAVRPVLRFHARYALEQDFDFARVEVSTNGGSAWQSIGEATGRQPVWERVQLSLQPYAGHADVRVRFRLQTDDSVAMDGFYLDDVRVGEAPAPVTLVTAAVDVTSVRLQWSASADPHFAAYRLYRGMSSNVADGAEYLVAEIANPAVTAWTDIAVSPKSTYFYVLQVVNTNDLASWSNELRAQTPAGMEAPFLDNGEGGPATWLADAPWALNADAAYGGALGWSDSPGTNYADGVNASLTLTAPVSIAGWARPTLMFMHRYEFLAGDYGYLEVSTNAGSAWTALASFTASSSSWIRARHDLSAFTNAGSLLVRFRVTSDGSGRADGWRLDDLSLSDAPETVAAPGVSDIQPTSLRLDWTASAHPALSHYVVARSTASNVTLNTQPQFTAASNRYVDTGLLVDSNCYYRVYAVDAWGGWSADSASSTWARTILPALPFNEYFEGGPALWALQGGWVFHTGDVFSGTGCLKTSAGNYSNNIDAAATVRLNFTGAARPVLRFRDSHRLAVNDYGYVEVSAPGRTGYRLYGVYGSRTNWEEQVIDLSYYKGYANVQILFRVTTDGNGTDDGWKIDELRVTDEGTAALATPFVEDFEGGLGNWVETNRWAMGGEGYQGTSRVEDAVALLTPDTYSLLSLDGDLNLTVLTNPQMVVWLKGSLGTYARLGLQVSPNGGQDWEEPWAVSAGWATTEWHRVQVALAPWKTSSARVRWQLNSYYGSLVDVNVKIDKLTVADAPAGVTVQTPVPALKTVQVKWSAGALGSRFQSYRVWRSPDGNPNNGNDAVVGVVTQEAVTSFVDSNLVIGATYYYWVYVTDTNDIWTLSTNYMAATTVPVVLPFADGFADAGQWDVTGSWGIDTNEGVLTESPVGDYASSEDSYAQTAVNLIGAVWPVLRFQDQYRLAADDYGYVEVSPSGSTWTRVYAVSVGARTNREEQVIDLSQWKNQANVRIRLHFTSSGPGTDDGWQIDDMSVTDRGAHPLPVPFYDGFEQGRTNWLESTWSVSTNTPFAGSNLLKIAGTHVPPDVQRRLPIGGSFDLSLATNPRVTYRIRGSVGYYASLLFQVSPDGGLTWADLWSVGAGWSTNQWMSHLFPLASYRTADVRFRFLLYSYWGSYAPVDVAIDHFSVGESSPGAPGLHSPAQFANTDTIRPTLAVFNAFDPDFDPLTYRFEVYDDGDLTNLMAQVPAVASGVDLTSWQVDVNLPNSRQYWWRCRASDASNTGPWMATATFYINETNTPPSAVLVAGPPKGATLRTGSGILSWYPSTDPDAGDVIATYHVQIDDDPAFGSLVVDAQVAGPSPAPTGDFVTISHPLNNLAGWQNLGMISNYFWRIRAQDSRFAWSPWTVGGHWFIYGVPAPDPATFVRNANGSMTFAWDVGTENWYVQWATSITGGWQTVAGPLGVNSWTFVPDVSRTSGFYRVYGE